VRAGQEVAFIFLNAKISAVLFEGDPAFLSAQVQQGTQVHRYRASHVHHYMALTDGLSCVEFLFYSCN
jgi:hypothetical protein